MGWIAWGAGAVAPDGTFKVVFETGLPGPAGFTSDPSKARRHATSGGAAEAARALNQGGAGVPGAFSWWAVPAGVLDTPKGRAAFLGVIRTSPPTGMPWSGGGS